MRSETKRSRSRASVRLLAAFLVVAIPAAVACGSEDDTRYGGPLGLSGKKVPPATTATGTATVTALAPCSDAGISTQEGGTCAVSFTNTIFGKYMVATGTWKCADAQCHGPDSSGSSFNLPTIDGTDPVKAYTALAQYTSLQSEPYINACTTDPGGSAMDCNLNAACTPAMPQAGAGVAPPGVTPAEIEDVETWLKCGAPLN